MCCLIFEGASTFQCWEGARVLTGKNVTVGSHSSFLSCFQAVEFGHEDCAATLLELGAQTDLRDFVGNTALHLATLGKSKRLVELLLEHNAHIDAVNMVILDFG